MHHPPSPFAATCTLAGCDAPPPQPPSPSPPLAQRLEYLLERAPEEAGSAGLLQVTMTPKHDWQERHPDFPDWLRRRAEAEAEAREAEAEARREQWEAKQAAAAAAAEAAEAAPPVGETAPAGAAP